MRHFLSMLLLAGVLTAGLMLFAQQSTRAPEAAAGQTPSAPPQNVPADIGPKNTSGRESQAAPPAPATAGTATDTHDPLLDVPPPPKGKATLIGGTVAKIDRVRNTIVLAPYGGSRVKVFFDERTHIFRGGAESTQMAVKKGDRVYIDTVLDGSRVFAKNIRVDGEVRAADAHGQLLAYDAQRGRLAMRDDLTSEPLTFRVTPETVVKRAGDAGTLGDLLPGSIIDVKFAPDTANRGVAREIAVLATPGSRFTFSGTVTFIDMRRGMAALDNRTDGRTYEIYFDPHSAKWTNVVTGSEATIDALFDGSRYTAVDLTLNSVAKKE
jgi:hypothetical protein